MERFCKYLKEHATTIINYEKKEMIPLTDEENKSYKKQKVCYICKKEFSTDDDNKKYHYTKNLGELLIVFVTLDTKHRKKFQ